MTIRTFFIALSFLTLLTIFSCESKSRAKYGFDFNQRWTWEELIAHTSVDSIHSMINSLRAKVSLSDAQFLLERLVLIDDPSHIKRFSEIEKQQAEMGGGFFGYLPEHFKDNDTIPLPGSFHGLIETAAYLAKIREQNLAILNDPAFLFRTEFSNEPFPAAPDIDLPKGMKYEIDLSAIEAVLDLYDVSDLRMQKAGFISRNDVFVQMLKHRRELGYVPGYLPNEKDLAQFIYLSSSWESLNMLWKWQNPCNFFGFADLFNQKEGYRNLVNTLREKSGSIEKIVLGRISEITADDLQFEDRLTFGVNFGIRSWATEFGFGTNIIQLKDDYPTMLKTVTHETFHRVQLQICPSYNEIKEGENRKFEDLTYFDFADKKDQKFFEILTYIFLEGTATYVGGPEASWDVVAGSEEGKKILEQCIETIYREKDLDKAEELMYSGLRSNGPFYVLGYHMSKSIADNSNDKELGEVITRGTIPFFMRYMKQDPSFFDNETSQLVLDLENKM